PLAFGTRIPFPARITYQRAGPERRLARNEQSRQVQSSPPVVGARTRAARCALVRWHWCDRGRVWCSPAWQVEAPLAEAGHPPQAEKRAHPARGIERVTQSGMENSAVIRQAAAARCEPEDRRESLGWGAARR